MDRVDRSNRHSQKQFLHLDHWINMPISREHDKYIWSVVRLRFGPVATFLKQIDRLTVKDNSCFTQHNHNMCTTDSQSKNNNTFTFEEAHTDGMHS